MDGARSKILRSLEKITTDGTKLKGTSEVPIIENSVKAVFKDQTSMLQKTGKSKQPATRNGDYTPAVPDLFLDGRITSDLVLIDHRNLQDGNGNQAKKINRY